jgi:predicted RNA binding protein YcfA (HicA-like mRNA interferase family)
VNDHLPLLPAREVIRALEKAGFRRVGQRGSHVKLKGLAGNVVIVPMHDELARGTLHSVLKQAGLSTDEFLNLL